MVPNPIQTPPLVTRKGYKLSQKGAHVRVYWEWLRVLKANLSSTYSIVALGQHWVGAALLVATDGSGLAWQPAELELNHVPQPGSTSVLDYEPGDPTVWHITAHGGEDRQPPPAGVPRGWSGGDPRRWIPRLAEERALFERGPRAVATVVNYSYNSAEATGEGDTDLARIDLTVNGAPQTWQEQLSWVNRAIRPNDEIAVALGPDGRIVALDTDERYLSDHGRCLVWTTPPSPW